MVRSSPRSRHSHRFDSDPGTTLQGPTTFFHVEAFEPPETPPPVPVAHRFGVALLVAGLIAGFGLVTLIEWARAL